MQVLPRTAAWVITRKLRHLRLPGRQVQCFQPPAHPQTLAGRNLRFASAEQQLTTALPQLVGRRCVGEAGKVDERCVKAPFRPLQGHAEAAVPRFFRRLAKRCRKVDSQPLERRIDTQAVVATAQADLQLIRQFARGRQRLLELQPVGQRLERHLAGGVDPGLHLPRLTLGDDLRRDRFAKCLQGNALAAQALVEIETEVALQTAKLQTGRRDLEPRIRRGEVNLDFRALAVRQGNVELDLALERPLTFPTGKDLARADRRFLENLQTIAKAAVEVAVEEQMTVLVTLDMRNVDTDIADLGVQQHAMTGPDAHAAVLDQHIAIDLLYLRPARLEVQHRIVNLEEQADAAGFGGSAVVQRALILEIALIHTAFDDCAAQPFVEARAQHFGQVLRRVAAVALGHADAQVHVVLTALFEQQSNEEVASDLAFFAQHLEVRGDQGEAFLVEGPGQACIGFLVVPGLGEDRVQVKHECIGVQAQFAVAQVTANAAADITGSRSAVIGVEPYPVEIGLELQTLVAFGFRPDIQAHIAQRTRDLQAIDHTHEGFRQRCQGFDQWRQRREVEAVGLDQPAFIGRLFA
ncbi:hypothetical protein D3C76_593350 [compost metagenome]